MAEDDIKDEVMDAFEQVIRSMGSPISPIEKDCCEECAKLEERFDAFIEDYKLQYSKDKEIMNKNFCIMKQKFKEMSIAISAVAT